MKELCLGTAMWGWSVNRDTAFAIMDCFYANGGRHVDTSNNYPLNDSRDDYRKSPLFLSEWCRLRGVEDLNITYKVGSISNEKKPENNLTPEYLESQIAWAREAFDENLRCVMLHWDNRQDLALIEDTLVYLDVLCESNLDLGLSGIANPELYRLGLASRKFQGLAIQVKHNFLYSALDDYAELACFSPKVWAYGISVSGLKLSEGEYNENSYVSLARGDDYHSSMLSSKLRNALIETISSNLIIENIYHVAIAFAEQEERLHGYLVAPSNLSQMQNIFKFLKNIVVENVDLSVFLNRNCI